MQKKFKRVICIVMTILMLVTVMPVTVFAAESCGNGTYWEYKKDPYMIFISGTGKADAVMSNYESNKDAPWYKATAWYKVGALKTPTKYNVRSIAKKVSVNGTSSVGSYAFSYLGEVTNVTCSASVKKIGHHAFLNDKKLNSVSLPSVSTIRESAFEGCSNLKTVSFPAVERIDARAFASSGLKNITLPESVKHIDSTAFAGCSGLTVTCVKGSYADTFCSNNGIKKNYSNNISLSAGFNMSSKNLELTVSLSGSKGFEAGVFTVTYNPEKMTYVNNSAVSASSGVDSGDIAVNSSTAGKLVISLMLKTGMSADPASLIKLAFKTSSNLAVQDSADFSVISSYMSVNGTEKEYNGAQLKNVNLHSYVSSSVASTCKVKGYTLHKCAICSKEYKDNTLKDFGPHQYKEIKNVPVTCTKDGSKTEKCSVCGDVKTTVFKATGHKYVETVVPPTCASDGYTFHKCSVCSDEYKDNIITDRNAHVFETTALTEPTCTEAGHKTEKCTICGFVQETDLPAAGHSYVDTVVPPTCTQKGYTLHKCSVCLNETKDNYTNTVAHTYEKQTTPAGCTEDGSNVYTCTVCGYSYSEKIPAPGHMWDDGVIARPATKTRRGILKYTCNVCGETRNEDIPALSDDDDTNNTTKPDDTNITTKPDNTSKVEIKEGETSISVDESSKYFKVVPPKSAGLSYAEFKGLFKTAPEIKNSDEDKVATSNKVTANGETYTIILLGDLDSNGKITAADARLILRISAKLDAPTETARLAGDLDSNGKITAKEARSVLRFSARLQSTIL